MKSDLGEITENMLIMHDKYSSVLQKIGKHSKQIAKCETRIQHIKAMLRKAKQSKSNDAQQDTENTEPTATPPRMEFKAQKSRKKEGTKRKPGKVEAKDLRGPKVNRALIHESNAPFAYKKRKPHIRLKRKQQLHQKDIDTPKRVRTDEEYP